MGISGMPTRTNSVTLESLVELVALETYTFRAAPLSDFTYCTSSITPTLAPTEFPLDVLHDCPFATSSTLETDRLTMPPLRLEACLRVLGWSPWSNQTKSTSQHHKTRPDDLRHGTQTSPREEQRPSGARRMTPPSSSRIAPALTTPMAHRSHAARIPSRMMLTCTSSPRH